MLRKVCATNRLGGVMKTVEREILCVRCKGSGEVLEAIDIYAAVFTLGLALLAGKSTCPKCDGTGKQWMRERVFEAEEVKP